MSNNRPGMPASAASGSESVLVAPGQIGWSVRLLHAAAGLQILVTVLSILDISSASFRARTKDALLDMGQGSMLESVVDNAVKFSLVTAVAGGMLAIAMYLVLAAFIGKGALWARLVGGIVAIGALYQLSALSMPGSIVTIVQILAVLAAITLCYLKPASTYFREKQIESLRRRRL